MYKKNVKAAGGPDKQKKLGENLKLPLFSYPLLGCSKEPSHRDGSFEYPQQMFW